MLHVILKNNYFKYIFHRTVEGTMQIYRGSDTCKESYALCNNNLNSTNVLLFFFTQLPLFNSATLSISSTLVPHLACYRQPFRSLSISAIFSLPLLSRIVYYKMIYNFRETDSTFVQTNVSIPCNDLIAMNSIQYTGRKYFFDHRLLTAV